MTGPTAVCVKYRCHVNNCPAASNDFIDRAKLRRHLITVDKLEFNKEECEKFRNNERYVYVAPGNSKKECIIHFGCAACMSHFGTMEELTEHFNIHCEHRKACKREFHETYSHNIEIPSLKRKFVFDRGLSLLPGPANGPKFNSMDIDKLDGFIFSVHYNVFRLGEKYIQLLQQHTDDAANLKSLQQYPLATKYLEQALDTNEDHESLLDYSWPLPDPSNGKIPKHEAQFYRVIKLNLIEFSSKCCRSQIMLTNHERTFFMDRVKPMFQYMADQAGLIHLLWGEASLQSRNDLSDLETWKAKQKALSDGLGSSLMMGYLDDERLIIESSSGGISEHVQHTSDDSLKLLEALQVILKLKASRFQNAQFTTLLDCRVFGILVVKRTMTLMSLRINAHKKYVYEEPRTCTVPITYFERYHWVQCFELLAYLNQRLLEQKDVDAKLLKENCGLRTSGKSTSESIRVVMQIKTD